MFHFESVSCSNSSKELELLEQLGDETMDELLLLGETIRTLMLDVFRPEDRVLELDEDRRGGVRRAWGVVDEGFDESLRLISTEVATSFDSGLRLLTRVLARGGVLFECDELPSDRIMLDLSVFPVDETDETRPDECFDIGFDFELLVEPLVMAIRCSLSFKNPFSALVAVVFIVSARRTVALARNLVRGFGTGTLVLAIICATTCCFSGSVSGRDESHSSFSQIVPSGTHAG